MSEVKIVITLKGNTASVGIQKPDCDPFFSRVEGDLPAVLESVPGLLEEAQRSWDANPRYPKCETALPSQAQPAAATSRASTTPRQRATAHPQMF